MNRFTKAKLFDFHLVYGQTEIDTWLQNCVGKDFPRGAYQTTKYSHMCLRTCLNMNPHITDAEYREVTINSNFCIEREFVECCGSKSRFWIMGTYSCNRIISNNYSALPYLTSFSSSKSSTTAAGR
ncbi:hypothetical protein NPIL_268161 [Nephila pilipes]|uniref:Uncharacterized protein n=1 Tax=Nephila pilipes TaxID=299642 RepID=A0A8X6Q2B0_NEPPI|nr:hypothetical protein NPIL_268161 [Nephila pilipes]